MHSIHFSSDNPQVCRDESVFGSENPNDFVHHCCTCVRSANFISPMQRCYGVDENAGHCDNCTCSLESIDVSVLLADCAKSENDELLIPILHLGWKKSVTVMSNVSKFCHLLFHLRPIP